MSDSSDCSDNNENSYLWQIRDKHLLKKIFKAKTGNQFKSNSFVISDVTWKLHLMPNTNKYDSNDSKCKIALISYDIPNNISSLLVNWTVECKEMNKKKSLKYKYSSKHFGKFLRLSSYLTFKKCKTFSFKVHLEILNKQYKNNNDNEDELRSNTSDLSNKENIDQTTANNDNFGWIKRKDKKEENNEQDNNSTNNDETDDVETSDLDTKDPQNNNMLQFHTLTKRFQDHVCIIIGGGSGIGQACAVRLAQEGGIIYILDHKSKRKGKKTLDLLKNTLHANDHEYVTCDASDKYQVQHVINDIIKQRSFIDVVINCVNTFDINQIPILNVCDVVLPYMANEYYGRIVNLIYLLDARRYIMELTKEYGIKYAGTGITVNCVSVKYDDYHVGKLNYDTEEIGKNVPMNRAIELAEISGVVAFIASEENTYMTGHCCDLCGGGGYDYNDDMYNEFEEEKKSKKINKKKRKQMDDDSDVSNDEPNSKRRKIDV